MMIEFATPTTVRRLRPDGSALDARMSPGPRGFAFACFEGEEPCESEVPNILLDVDKHASAKSCTKRPPPTAKPYMKRHPVNLEPEDRMSKKCGRSMCIIDHYKKADGFGLRRNFDQELDPVGSWVMSVSQSWLAAIPKKL